MSGTRADLVIWPELFEAGFVETIDHNINAFNGASNGGIVLETRMTAGDFMSKRFFDRVEILSNRNPNSVGSAAKKKLTMSAADIIKVNRRLGPVTMTLDSFRKAGMSPEQMSLQFGRLAGEQVFADYLAAALASLVATIGSESALITEVDNELTMAGLNTGLSKFGDAAGRIVCWIGHSTPFFELTGGNLESGLILGPISAFNAVTGTSNRPWISTDSEHLVITETVEDVTSVAGYRTLGLVAGGAVITESEDSGLFSNILTGYDNLLIELQSEHAFNIDIKGFGWDTGEGGISPDTDDLATAANWDALSPNRKDLPGVLIESGLPASD